MLHLIYKSIYFASLLLISINDIKKYVIPNLLLLVCFGVLLILDILDVTFSFEKVFSMLFLFAVFFLCYKFKGGLGFGDIKLAALIGYYSGMMKGIMACLAGCLFGIIFFLIFIRDKKKKIPFGPFLSLGAIFAELV